MISTSQNTPIWLGHMFRMDFSGTIDGYNYSVFSKLYIGRSVRIFNYSRLYLDAAQFIYGSPIGPQSLFIYQAPSLNHYSLSPFSNSSCTCSSGSGVLFNLWPSGSAISERVSVG